MVVLSIFYDYLFPRDPICFKKNIKNSPYIHYAPTLLIHVENGICNRDMILKLLFLYIGMHFLSIFQSFQASPCSKHTGKSDQIDFLVLSQHFREQFMRQLNIFSLCISRNHCILGDNFSLRNFVKYFGCIVNISTFPHLHILSKVHF